jgi:hypothetical protein
VHRLHEALCDLYCGHIERSIREFHPNGFWANDDLGCQRARVWRPVDLVIRRINTDEKESRAIGHSLKQLATALSFER